MPLGYGGRILRANLSTRTHQIEPLPDELAHDYLGGRGFVARMLWDEVPTHSDPLGPDNCLVVAAGPLSGSFLPSSGKIAFGSKSPLTGGYGDSNMGGHLSSELKTAGFDLVIIQGKAKEPVSLVIDDDNISLIDSSKYWGVGSYATEAGLKEDLGKEFQIATIGPAGERLVKYSCITHDFGRQAGRAGIGAVMGSKNLKAIAVRGTKGYKVADPDAVLAKGKEMYKAVFELPGFTAWTPYGTALIVDWCNQNGAFPTRNFRSGRFDDYEKINGIALREIVVKDKGCFSCPIPCGKYTRSEFKGTEVYVEGPEYETIAMFGGSCALSDIRHIAYLNHMMDDLGMDTISGGNAIAFAIECYEKGILTKADTGGQELRFGDVDSVVFLANKIAAREGIGDVLAEGVRVASQVFGGGSDRFAIHVKGMEVSGYEPRYAAATLLAYMTCDVGAHHNRAWAITHDIAVGRELLEGKAQKVIELQHVRPLLDMLTVCRFPWIELGFDLSHYVDVLRHITGIGYTWNDLLTISERAWNLTRAFWVREVPGFGRKYDYPPERFIVEPVESGPTKGRVLGREAIDSLLKDYYALRGWDDNGIPTGDKLRGLELGDVAKVLGR